MSFVIGIDGIDNSGKSSTIESLIKRLEKEGFSANIAPKRIKLEKRFPDSLRERKRWYREGNTNEIIDVNLSSALKRNKALKNMDDDIILESRGYATIFSSMIASAMNRFETSYKKGKRIVKDINKNIGYFPIEDYSFALSFGQDSNYALEEIKTRDDKEEINNGFEKYLKKFNESFEDFTEKQKDLTKLNAYKSINENVNCILKLIYFLMTQNEKQKNEIRRGHSFL